MDIVFVTELVADDLVPPSQHSIMVGIALRLSATLHARACREFKIIFAVQMLATYPINAARNMAMLLARTELVFPMDIDLLPSRDFSDIVLDPKRQGLAPDTLKVRSVVRIPAEDEVLLHWHLNECYFAATLSTSALTTKVELPLFIVLYFI